MRSERPRLNARVEDSRGVANGNSELKDTDLKAVLEEMERWHDILKHEGLPKVRGPRP